MKLTVCFSHTRHSIAVNGLELALIWTDQLNKQSTRLVRSLDKKLSWIFWFSINDRCGLLSRMHRGNSAAISSWVELRVPLYIESSTVSDDFQQAANFLLLSVTSSIHGGNLHSAKLLVELSWVEFNELMLSHVVTHLELYRLMHITVFSIWLNCSDYSPGLNQFFKADSTNHTYLLSKVEVCRKLKIGSYLVFENQTVQKFDIRSADGFPIEAVYNLQFKLRVTKTTLLADKVRFETRLKQSLAYRFFINYSIKGCNICCKLLLKYYITSK